MHTLKLVHDSNNKSEINKSIGPETGDTADKIDCILMYLRSLEQEAAKVYGENDDWRYGRYLVHGLLISALKNAER